MGCCENMNNLFSNNNKDLSNSLFLKGIKEENFNKTNNKYKNSNKINKNSNENKVGHYFYKNNSTSKIQLGNIDKNKTLDKINEVESEYKESSIINSILISKEKITPKNKINIYQNLAKNNIKTRKNNEIQILRNNRSRPEIKTILSEDIFYKKLNEYNSQINKKKVIYLNNLKRIKSVKNNNNNTYLIDIIREFSFKDPNFRVSYETNNKREIRNVKYKLFNEFLKIRNSGKDSINNTPLQKTLHKSKSFK